MQMIDEFNIERLGPLFRCITNTSIEHILQFPKQKLYFKHCTSLIRVKIALHAFSVLKVNDPYHNFYMDFGNDYPYSSWFLGCTFLRMKKLTLDFKDTLEFYNWIALDFFKTFPALEDLVLLVSAWQRGIIYGESRDEWLNKIRTDLNSRLEYLYHGQLTITLIA